MKAIKCPNCGSEKCKEITEEKWVCLACDNIFLVHNLSKEFQKTDSHISEVHQDISEKLSEIKNIAGSSGNDDGKLMELLYDAEEQLKNGDFFIAYELFKKYSFIKPESYVGYEGMFRALTDNYEDDVEECYGCAEGDTLTEVLAPANNAFDVLKKALKCEDCPKERLLSKALTYYKRGIKSMIISNSRISLGTAIYGDSDDFQQNYPDPDHSTNEEFDSFWSYYQGKIKEDAENLLENLKKTIEYKKQIISDYKNELEKNKAELEQYNSLEKKEKILLTIKPYIPFFILVGVTFLSCLFNFLVAFIFIVVDCIVFKKIHEKNNKPYDNQDSFTEDIKYHESDISLLEEAVDIVQTVDSMELNDLEIQINNWNNSYISADEWYALFAERRRVREEKEAQEAELEAEIAEGYFQVTIGNWGKNPSMVREILLNHCNEKKWVNEKYKNEEQCTITGFRKTVAYNLQEQLMNVGASAYVNKM